MAIQVAVALGVLVALGACGGASPGGGNSSGGGLTGLSNGTTDDYVIREEGDAGVSPASEEVHATPGEALTPPGAPTGLQATAVDRQVVLRWTPSEGAASYEVLRDAGCTGSFVSVATPTAAAYSDTGLINDTSYCYTVKAVNAQGASPPSLQVSATPKPVPSAPTNVIAEPWDEQVTLRWTASAGATLYAIYSDPGCTGAYRLLGTSHSTTDTFGGLTNDTPYCFLLSAGNAVGWGLASCEVRATPKSGLPCSPSGLTAKPGDLRVTLEWYASDGATSYAVLRDTGCTGAFVSVATPAGTAHTDTGLTNGTSNCYTVMARNSVGSSSHSSQASATPMAVLPTPPTWLTATSRDGRVELNWWPSEWATSYAILRDERCTSGFTEIATATGTTYTDTTVTNGTRYCYAMVARNSVGSSQLSRMSSATPWPKPAAPLDLVAMAGNSQVVLEWGASEGATSYELLRDVGCTGNFVKKDMSYESFEKRRLIETGLLNGTPYCYKVQATNNEGSSPPSALAQATPKQGLPVAPPSFTHERYDTGVLLLWEYAGGYDYEVWVAVGCNGSGTLDHTSFTHQAVVLNLALGVSHCFRVRGRNSEGKGPFSEWRYDSPRNAYLTSPVLQTD